MAVTVKLNEFGKVLEQFGHRTLEEQKAAVARGLAKSIPMLVEKSPVDTGLYAASWDFTVDEQSAILGNFAPHAPIIEDGARPFVPPIRPLLEWAKRVLKSPSQPPDFDSEVWALAKGTQNKIAQFGMAPKHILQNALPDIIQNIKQELLNG